MGYERAFYREIFQKEEKTAEKKSNAGAVVTS